MFPETFSDCSPGRVAPRTSTLLRSTGHANYCLDIQSYVVECSGKVPTPTRTIRCRLAMTVSPSKSQDRPSQFQDACGPFPDYCFQGLQGACQILLASSTLMYCRYFATGRSVCHHAGAGFYSNNSLVHSTRATVLGESLVRIHVFNRKRYFQRRCERS